MPTATLSTKDKMSIAATVVKRIWRCRSAPCCTPAALNRNPAPSRAVTPRMRSEEHTSELQSLTNLVCRLLLEKKKKKKKKKTNHKKKKIKKINQKLWLNRTT